MGRKEPKVPLQLTNEEVEKINAYRRAVNYFIYRTDIFI